MLLSMKVIPTSAGDWNYRLVSHDGSVLNTQWKKIHWQISCKD